MSMVFAKPIVAMIDGDGRKIILDSEGGFICEENAESLAKALLNMKNLSLEQRKNLGTNNINFYKKNFSQLEISKKIEKELFKNKTL